VSSSAGWPSPFDKLAFQPLHLFVRDGVQLLRPDKGIRWTRMIDCLVITPLDFKRFATWGVSVQHLFRMPLSCLACTK